VLFWLIIGSFYPSYSQSQKHVAWPKFSHADSLRGTLDSLRAAYKVVRYDITIEPSFAKHSIVGRTTIVMKWLKACNTFRFDLDTHLHISSIEYRGKMMPYTKDGAAVFVNLQAIKIKKKNDAITISYAGSPTISKKAPWEGGLVWDTIQGKPWMGTTCEGEGASLWYACNDHLSSKAEGTDITIITPADLVGISNGNLIESTTLSSGKKSWHWRCTYPAPNYSIAVYVGAYSHIADTYKSATKKTALALDYFVLNGHEQKAKQHFAQVKGMLAAYEHYLGPYPFWRDGYALVETPYWGMEHQSAIAYGNKFRNNEFGFDFIIIHESGHEYFGNAVSADDHANMFIQEGFCTYLETLYLEYTQGKAVSEKWLASEQKQIANKVPMAGPEKVNYTKFQDNDAYYKGACMLHTFRKLAGDSLFFATLRSFYQACEYKSISLDTYNALFVKPLGKSIENLSKVYLHEAALPIIEYSITKEGVSLRYKTDSEDAIILPIKLSKVVQDIKLTKQFQLIKGASQVPELSDSKMLFQFQLINKL